MLQEPGALSCGPRTRRRQVRGPSGHGSRRRTCRHPGALLPQPGACLVLRGLSSRLLTKLSEGEEWGDQRSEEGVVCQEGVWKPAETHRV